MIVSVTKPTMPSITMSFRLVSFSLISSHAAAGPPVMSATTISKAVSRPFMIVSPLGPRALTILARICAQRDAKHAQGKHAELGQREGLGDIDAGQRAGEPIDERGFEMRAEVLDEVLRPSLAASIRWRDKDQRVLEDVLEGRADLAEVGHDSRRDDLEDDLQQIPDLAAGPTDELDRGTRRRRRRSS